MSCNCNKPKCDGKCGISPSVLQINNPGDCTLFHRVEVPASMGDSKTNPPKNGDYRNVLLYYVADGTSWLFSSDGIPQKLVSGFTDYEDAINLPSINGVTLLRNKTGEELGLQNKLTAGGGIEISSNNTISISGVEQYAHSFDTVADMKSATNLIAGDYARTLGYNSITDKGGASYKIIATGTTDDIELDSGLYAHLIADSEYDSNMFDIYGITVETDRYSNGTKYYITHIPYINNLGLRNELVQGFPNDDYGNYDDETARDFAKRKNSPFVMNIGLWNTDNRVPFGPIVQDGVEETPSHSNAFSPIGIDADGMVTVYSNGTTASDMIADGVVYGCCAYDELIHDNVVVYDTSTPAWTTTLYQHQIFAQLDNGDYVILTCDGKDYEAQDVGMTFEMLCNVLMAKYDNIRTAYACDGGGSTSTVVNHEFINTPSDNDFRTERALCSTMWYIKPINSVDNFLSLYNKIGDIEAQLKMLKSQVEYNNTLFGNHGTITKYNGIVERVNATDGKFRVTNVTDNKDVVYFDMAGSDTNEFYIDGQRVYAPYKLMKQPSDYTITDADNINFACNLMCNASSITNVPDPTIAHVLITLPILSTTNLIQIAIPYNTNTDYVTQYRYKASGTWRAWRTL